ncbi:MULTISPECIES: citrate synthase [unclassified Streptomyces]|uniref:citrate synthase n=1 Tax=unclassified Streptomyces TaxID=2593676 RepID=UPI000CD4B84E|nr:MULTISPECIES: citrate synthase [unclassified Streptomyces]
MTDQQDSDDRLTTRQTAERLGVKAETVYAYVSRGLLTRRRAPEGRGSTFDAREVEALARHSARRPQSSRPTPFTPLATGITLIERDRCYYRGVDTTALATRYGYEEVADWLWTGDLTAGIRFRAPQEQLDAARACVAALPAHSATEDRLHAAVVGACAADPLRSDLAPAAVHATARALIAALVDAQPPLGPEPAPDAPLADRLWARLTAHAPTGAGVRALDAALVLLIDHDLAVSTLAARVAATARAHPYAVVLAGLGALDGPLHGAAAAPAHRMVAEVLDHGSAAAVVAGRIREQRGVPGLGHLLYPAEDPRATALFALLAEVPAAREPLGAAREVAAAAGRQRAAHANIDLALAVLTVSCGMRPEAGQAVFAVARTAGWIAHALEEYTEPAMRLRPSGAYRGPRPPRELP